MKSSDNLIEIPIINPMINTLYKVLLDHIASINIPNRELSSEDLAKVGLKTLENSSLMDTTTDLYKYISRKLSVYNYCSLCFNPHSEKLLFTSFDEIYIEDREYRIKNNQKLISKNDFEDTLELIKTIRTEYNGYTLHLFTIKTI